MSKKEKQESSDDLLSWQIVLPMIGLYMAWQFMQEKSLKDPPGGGGVNQYFKNRGEPKIDLKSEPVYKPTQKPYQGKIEDHNSNYECEEPSPDSKEVKHRPSVDIKPEPSKNKPILQRREIPSPPPKYYAPAQEISSPNSAGAGPPPPLPQPTSTKKISYRLRAMALQ